MSLLNLSLKLLNSAHFHTITSFKVSSTLRNEMSTVKKKKKEQGTTKEDSTEWPQLEWRRAGTERGAHSICDSCLFNTLYLRASDGHRLFSWLWGGFLCHVYASVTENTSIYYVSPQLDHNNTPWWREWFHGEICLDKDPWISEQYIKITESNMENNA